MPEYSMQYRPLGRTGEQVSVIGLGGWHLALKNVSEPTAERIVHGAVDRGITFMDNSWDYNDGESERRMGRALRGSRRDRVFLMTKIDGRTKKLAQQQLEESLDRLQTDRIDLVQHHEILRFEDPHRIFDEEGAQVALEEARKAGKVRHIGFTGHKDPRIHLYMLEVAREKGVRMDTVQMPLNVMDAHYRSFEKLVLPELSRDSIAALAMKPLGNGIILRSGAVSAVECLQYALRLPVSVVITGIDRPEYLDQAFEAVGTYEALEENDVQGILARTAQPAKAGEFEPFKTTSLFDATAVNPDWLGEEPARLQALIQE